MGKVERWSNCEHHLAPFFGEQHFAESFAVSTTASRFATVRERYCMSFQRFLLHSRSRSGACGCLSRISVSAFTTTTDRADSFRPLIYLEHTSTDLANAASATVTAFCVLLGYAFKALLGL
jgi:hypothetical protein